MDFGGRSVDRNLKPKVAILCKAFDFIAREQQRVGDHYERCAVVMKNVHDVEQSIAKEQRLTSRDDALKDAAVGNNLMRQLEPSVDSHERVAIAIARTIVTMLALEIALPGELELQRDRIIELLGISTGVLQRRDVGLHRLQIFRVSR